MKSKSKQRAGRLGAMALNSDPVKKSAATKKAAATRKAQNPNIFREMGAMGGRPSINQLQRTKSHQCIIFEVKKP